MKLAQFRNLRPAMQARFVLTIGTYLLYRLDEEAEVYLYYLNGADKGFFVEMAYAENRDELVVLRSFAGVALLEQYAPYLPLPQF